MAVIAQINGFSFEAEGFEIQERWNDLKSTYGRTLIGHTLKFFQAKKIGDRYVITNFKPIKEFVYNG